MKKHLLLLIAMLTALPMIARDFTYTYEGQTLTYTVLDEEAKTCQTKEGLSNSPGNKLSGNLIIPDIAINDGTEFTVIGIGDDGFRNCKDLNSVTIPSSVTSVCDYAFYNCLRLSSLTIGSSVNMIGVCAFEGCEALTSVTIPSSVTTIGEDAFKNCSSLSSLTIGFSVTTIENSAFEGCEALTSLTIPSSVNYIGDNAFNGCNIKDVIFEDGQEILKLGTGGNSSYYGLLSNCPLETLYLGRNLKYNTSPFYNNRSLTKVEIGPTVTSIGKKEFQLCTNLWSLTLGPSVVSIGENAFEYNIISSVIFPDSVTSIGSNAFYCSYCLSSLTIGSSVTTIGGQAFWGSIYLTSVKIPASVKKIKYEAFSGCSSISKVYIEDINAWSQIEFGTETSNPISNSKTFFVNNTEITHLNLDIADSDVSPYAFYNAENLNTIRIKANNVGNSSFQNCKNVRSICLDVNSLDSESFSQCSRIKNVYCITPEPPTAPDDAFSNYDKATLYVPVGSQSIYKNCNKCWCNFSSIIETDFEGIDEIFNDENDFETMIQEISAENVAEEINFSAPYEVFNLNGIYVATSVKDLAPGMYIVRQNNAVKKVSIR